MSVAAAPEMWAQQSAVRRLSPALVRGFLKLTSRLTVTGLEHVPPRGPLIVVANHLFHLEPPLLLAVLPWPINFMAVAGLFDVPGTGHALRAYGTIKLNRGEVDRTALKQALQVLQEGGILGIFPEGTQSPTGALIGAKAGTAWLAARSGAPLLPIGITGTDRFVANLRRGRRTEIGIHIGEPFRLQVRSQDREALKAAAGEIMGRIAALLPQEYRGVYA